jgi:hypothetical protein
VEHKEAELLEAFMSGTRVRAVAVLGAACVIAAAGTAASATAATTAEHRAPARHVLLLSVDGLHQSDLTWYVNAYPRSALAALVKGGVDFTHAQTPVPSDSFPGMVAQVTGGNPASTGVYYDDSWNHSLLPAGTTSCAGVTRGAEVTYFEALDKDPLALDAGQGLPGLPGSILNMTGNPRALIDPAQLPVDPRTCTPVYPHSYLKVNTVFEVARAHGLGTAWSDKHPAYEILNGPSGAGVQDLFTPEINSTADTAGDDWTTDNNLTQVYDGYKVQSVLNEIDGYDHSGRTETPVPAIFGMNFQTVSTAEKLPASDGLTGGYLADGTTPGPLLTRGLQYVDYQVGRMVQELRREHLAGSTTIILSAKHGQSPQQPAALTRIDDGPLIDAVNTAWASTHPAWVGAHPGLSLVQGGTDDDALMWWLNDKSQAAADFAKKTLLTLSGTGNDITGAPKPYQHAGLATIYAGKQAATYFGVGAGDNRVPDIWGIVQHGVVYTGKQKKIAEHGGADPQDRNVPIVVSGAGVDPHSPRLAHVETTQIAPTILTLLGLDPDQLQAVTIEHTQALPLS